MISLLCRRRVLLFCLVIMPASRLAAEQVHPSIDARRSLQIPPQDILNLSTVETRPSVPEAPALPDEPTTRPTDLAVPADRGPLAVERAGFSNGPAVPRPEVPGSESRPLNRTADPERRALAVRASELKDVSRTQRGGNPWSARDLWPLLSVLALILVLAWVVKRSMRGRRVLAGSGAIEVLSRTALSSKQSLVLVRMGRRLLLLGVTGDEMNTLCVVEDPDQVAMLVGEAASGRSGSMTQAFARTFVDESRAYEPDLMEEEEENADAREPVRSLLDKIRHLSSRRNVA